MYYTSTCRRIITFICLYIAVECVSLSEYFHLINMKCCIKMVLLTLTYGFGSQFFNPLKATGNFTYHKGQWHTEGGGVWGGSNPPKFRRSFKIVPHSTRL